jgi:hypothetical protein
MGESLYHRFQLLLTAIGKPSTKEKLFTRNRKEGLGLNHPYANYRCLFPILASKIHLASCSQGAISKIVDMIKNTP